MASISTFMRGSTSDVTEASIPERFARVSDACSDSGTASKPARPSGNTDPFDPRETPDAAKEAVLAWVAERNGWVSERELVVVEANVMVLPGTLPAGTDRVLPGGQFVPAAAPKPPTSEKR